MRLWRRQQDKNPPPNRRWQRLANSSFWLEAVMLPLGMFALLALPLSAWLQLGATWVTTDAAQALLPAWVLLLILLVAFWLARWLTGPSKPGRWAFFLVWACGLTTLLLTWYFRFYTNNGPFWQFGWLGTVVQDVQDDNGPIAGVIGTLILLALLWWRGLRLGRDQIEFEQVSRSFKLGFAGLVASLLLLGTVDPTARMILGAQLGLTLGYFLFAGLVALSLARLAEIRRLHRARGNTQADPTRSWAGAMLALSGGLVLGALGIEQIFSYQSWLAIISTLQPIWDAISTVIGWIALGLGYVIYWIVSPIAQWIQSLYQQGSQEEQPSPASSLRKPVGGNNGSLPAEWLAVGRWVLICVGVVILLVLLIRVFRGAASRWRSYGADEERENLEATGILKAQLRSLLARLAARFQRKPSGEGPLDSAANSPIRQLYRRLLRQAEASGLGRSRPETPEEFARRLAPALAAPASPAVSTSSPAGKVSASSQSPDLPDIHDTDLDALTAAYEQARYGDQEPPPPQFSALASDAEHLLLRLAQRQGAILPRKEPTSR